MFIFPATSQSSVAVSTKISVHPKVAPCPIQNGQLLPRSQGPSAASWHTGPCTCPAHATSAPDSLGVVCPLCLSTYLDGLASSPSALLAPAYSPLASQGLGPHLPAPPLPLGARGRLPPGPSSSLPPGEGGTKGPLSPQGWGWAACRLGPTSSFLEKMGSALLHPSLH